MIKKNQLNCTAPLHQNIELTRNRKEIF
ncbi:ribosomal protein S16 [Iris pallida]|uniref:Ribosomal protein S16 (Chloroplast) n=1 Tax=Iris pallida TaxID=29817 RepID=A0AAX6IF02_IRIPA|nr:ribosomal protein S16 [Iris pallida]